VHRSPWHHRDLCQSECMQCIVLNRTVAPLRPSETRAVQVLAGIV
jgi:hypothetical protein